eukprot:s2459_g8.t1
MWMTSWRLEKGPLFGRCCPGSEKNGGAASGSAVKFCGFELTRCGDYVQLSQKSYLKDLVGRYDGIAMKSSPMPANLDESLEETIEVSDIRAAQAIVGELLWASCRTRPDLAYGVSWMGRMVTKAPRRVKQYGEHMIGYVKSTLEMSLSYGKCPGPTEDENLAFPRSMQRLEIHSDASFAPAGGKGHQGLIAMYGGVPVQWESKQQSFGTLSTAEAELLGYTDGFTLGESVAAVVELLEPGGLTDKAVVFAASWQKFRRWMSLILPEEVKAEDHGNGAWPLRALQRSPRRSVLDHGNRWSLGSHLTEVQMICGCKFLVVGWREFIGNIAAGSSTPSTEAVLSKLQIWRTDADIWQNGQIPPAPPVAGTWIGWTFFRLDGRSSSAQPRIQPDTVVWSAFGIGEGISRYGIGQHKSVWVGTFSEFGWELVGGRVRLSAKGCSLEAKSESVATETGLESSILETSRLTLAAEKRILSTSAKDIRSRAVQMSAMRSFGAVHGERFEPARSEYEEAVESEEGSDGDFSLVTEQIEESPAAMDPPVEEDRHHHPDEASDM